MTHLVSLDPAKTKPSWGASFLDGKFQKFIKVDYRQITKPNYLDTISRCLYFKHHMDNVCLIERPYINRANSPRSQISLAIVCGEIALYMRLQGFRIEFPDSWGSKGWLQQFFGRATREVMLETSLQIAKVDGVSVKNNDQSMAYCMGRWWLRNNPNGVKNEVTK